MGARDPVRLLGTKRVQTLDGFQKRKKMNMMATVVMKNQMVTFRWATLTGNKADGA